GEHKGSVWACCGHRGDMSMLSCPTISCRRIPAPRCSRKRSSPRSATLLCGRRSRSCPVAAASCSPCCSVITRTAMKTSAQRWACEWAASARCGLAAWTGCANHRTSPPLPTAPGTSRQGVNVVTDGWHDEELLAALRQAPAARRAVPPEFVEAGKNAFAWHNIDAELAQLTYDSTHAPQLEAATRAESASIRALTFTSARITLELEVTENSLLGQVVPAQAATIDVDAHDSPDTHLPTPQIAS